MINIEESLKRIFHHVVVPVASGATVAYIAQKTGHDIFLVEGMKQSVISGLPILVLASNRKDTISDNELERMGNMPYLLPAIMIGYCALLRFVGSYGAELVSDKEISQSFVSIVGGLEGLVAGVYYSTKGRLTSEKNDR